MAAASPTVNVSENQLNERVRGLDTIRLFLALWVVFGHIGFLPLRFNESHILGKVATVIYGNSFSGPSAVIVFFVISGFCIHYPFRHGKPLLLVPYFSRRNLRIWLPIIVAVIAAKPLGVNFSFFQESILWSLIAEEIYYLIYPFLLSSKRRFGWQKIIIVAYIGAFLVILTNPTAGNYPSYGTQLNWLLGLPCWLLGCCLAERTDSLRALASNLTSNASIRIWRWRFGAWFLSVVCSTLRFHSPIKYPWTLTLFAVFAFFWLQQEIIYYFRNRPVALLENSGKGSYSIYLVHLLGPALYVAASLPTLAPIPLWCAHILLTLLICTLFYFSVEKPSHKLARRVADKLSRQPNLASVSSRG